MMSLPTLASVVHLQLLMALTAQRLCDLNLHTSQLRPCDVTPGKDHTQKKNKKKTAENSINNYSEQIIHNQIINHNISTINR